jgi:hypothetical protein
MNCFGQNDIASLTPVPSNFSTVSPAWPAGMWYQLPTRNEKKSVGVLLAAWDKEKQSGNATHLAMRVASPYFFFAAVSAFSSLWHDKRIRLLLL